MTRRGRKSVERLVGRRIRRCGQARALFKSDDGRLHQEIFRELKLLEHGLLTREQGWDDVTFLLFEKRHQKS